MTLPKAKFYCYEDCQKTIFVAGIRLFAGYDNSVLKIVETKPADALKKVRYWIDCGDDDFLTKGNSLLHILLTEKKVPHEYRVRDGAHTWTYWRTGITDALRFIGDSFRQK